MRRFVLAAALLVVSTSAHAASVSFGTGVAPWLVNGNPAVLESPLEPGFVGNANGGAWIGPSQSSANPGEPQGTYVFTLNVGAYQGTGGNFEVSYAAAQSVAWSITNGSLAGSTACTGPCFGSFRTLTGTFAATSVLTATVQNLGNAAPTLVDLDDEFRVPLGLIVLDPLDTDVNVPEPTMLALFGAAALGLVSRLRRR